MGRDGMAAQNRWRRVDEGEVVSYLEDQKQAHLKRMLGFTLLFAVLGCITLFFAINYISGIITNALK
jgi:hypothetical protein